MELTLTIIAIVIVGLIALFVTSFTVQVYRLGKQLKNIEHIEENSIVPTVIVERSKEILGYYQDLSIHKTVKLDDGSIYEFLSVAVQIAPNWFATETPNENHILVDGLLLYREVK